MWSQMNNFKEIVKLVVENYGIEILNDIRRVNALFMDYAPNLIRERKLITLALKEGIGSQLINVINSSTQEQQLTIKKCIHHLKTDAWMNEETAIFAVDIIAFSVGIVTAENKTVKQNQKKYKVLEKGKYEFTNTQNINSILMMHEVIGFKAFAAQKNLTEIKIPECIKKIKSKAFLNCINLKYINIPNSTKEIGFQVFAGCNALEKIYLENNVNYAVVKGLLIDRKKKTLMKATTSIETECIIPDNICYIQSRAFEYSNVKTIILPLALANLEKNAFIYCKNLECFHIDRKNEYYSTIEGVLYTKDKSKLIRFPSGKKCINYIIDDATEHISYRAFSRAKNIESITFTSTLKSIGMKAFEHCENLSSITLPSSVEIIGEYAFQFCRLLTSAMLSYNVKEICDYAFYECSSIETISIPKNVKRIGNCTFKNCVKLRNVIIQDNVEFIGDEAFKGCKVKISIKNNVYVERYCNTHGIMWERI